MPTKNVVKELGFMGKKKKLAAAAPVAAKAAGKLTDGDDKPKKKKGFRRLVLLSLISGVGALVASESLRSKLLDMLFGAEEEFQYTPPASTPAPPPAAPVTAA